MHVLLLRWAHSLNTGICKDLKRGRSSDRIARVFDSGRSTSCSGLLVFLFPLLEVSLSLSFNRNNRSSSTQLRSCHVPSAQVCKASWKPVRDCLALAAALRPVRLPPFAASLRVLNGRLEGLGCAVLQPMKLAGIWRVFQHREA